MINPEKFHPCQNYCSRWSGEPCSTCLVPEPECGKPVEWLGIYCQECWEQHSAVLPMISVRPDEAEILPAPCATCAVKDHDLTVLRKLQASNLSTYAKRVHSQQTHILIYEVIIGALIVACIGLILWGLK